MTREAVTAPAWPADGLERQATCPGCGSPDREPLYAGLRDRVFGVAPGEWTLMRCAACGSAYLDPRPTRDTIGIAYSSYFTHDESPGGAGATGVRARLVNAHLASRWGYAAAPAFPFGAAVGWLLPARAAVVDREHRHLDAAPAGRLLDVGSGSGAFVARMRALGWDAEGVEPDPRAVAVARAAGLPVRAGTAEDLVAGSDERYDAVTLDHVVEHLHDPAATLHALHSLLRPGGSLWIATPNLESLGHRRFGRDWLHLDPPRHLVLFNTASLEALLRRCGFEPLGSPRPAPTAALTFPRSAAIRAGRLARDDGEDEEAGLRLGALAAIADRRAARDPGLAEELVLRARRAGG